jgi:hypothetical protein
MSKRGDRGGTYLVCWEQHSGGLRAWLRDRPSLSVEAEDREEAEEELGMQIMEWNGDGEACFEWEIRGDTPANEYRSLSYNDRVDVLNPREELFEQGVCGRCGRGIGPRNEVAAVLARSPQSDVFRLERPFPKDIYPTRTCVSGRFLELLSADEVARLEPRAVVAPPRVRMRYYEICGKPVAQARALVGCPFLNQLQQSWECTACGQHAFMQDTPYKSGTVILSEQDLGPQSGDMFLYCNGGTRGPTPMFSLTRWKSLQQAAGKRLKGLLSDPLLVVPEALCMKELGLPDYVG